MLAHEPDGTTTCWLSAKSLSRLRASGFASDQ